MLRKMKFIIFIHCINFLVKELVASSTSSLHSEKRKHDLILIPIENRHMNKDTSESIQTPFDGNTSKLLSANWVGTEFDHIHVVFPRILSDHSPDSESAAQNYMNKLDPRPRHPFLSFSILITIYAGLAFEKARKKRRQRNERKNELELDVCMSVIPTGADYGSFSIPWAGDLEKYDI